MKIETGEENLSNPNAYSAIGIYYIDVSMTGANGKVYGEAWSTGGIPSHNIKIDLCKNTTSVFPTEIVDSETTSKLGGIMNLTTVVGNTINTANWQVNLSGTISGKRFNYSTYAFAYNKKAVRYPQYTDVESGKEMRFPTLGLKVVDKEQRVRWTDTERKAFKTEYEKRYNNGKSMDWTGIEIHHIDPREYGGTNNFNNLIPLPKEFHRKQVNSWWKNY